MLYRAEMRYYEALDVVVLVCRSLWVGDLSTEVSRKAAHNREAIV